MISMKVFINSLIVKDIITYLYLSLSTYQGYNIGIELFMFRKQFLCLSFQDIFWSLYVIPFRLIEKAKLQIRLQSSPQKKHGINNTVPSCIQYLHTGDQFLSPSLLNLFLCTKVGDNYLLNMMKNSTNRTFDFLS